MDTKYLDNIDPMTIVDLKISGYHGVNIFGGSSSTKYKCSLYEVIKEAYYAIIFDKTVQAKILLEHKILYNDEVKYLYFRLSNYCPPRSRGMSVTEP